MEKRSSAAGPFDRALAAALRAAAAERQVSQVHIAKRSGISSRTLARYMRGTSPIPVARLEDIGPAIGVTPEAMLKAARVIAQRHGDAAPT